MHMADALLSPAVGTAMWGAAAATIAYSSMKVKKELDDRRIPLMGVLGAFIFAGAQATQRRMTGGAIVAAVAGLQLGAFGVVLETVASGISSLPFATFVGLMQPIHLAIGIVEGLVTATVVAFVYKARPEIVAGAMASQPVGTAPLRRILFSFLAAALLTGGVVSWFASENPDGLEWAIARVTGAEEVAAGESPLHHGLADLQEKIAFLPDYSFRQGVATDHGATVSAGETGQDKASRLGTSVAGGVGALLSLAIAFCLGFVLKRRHQVA